MNPRRPNVGNRPGARPGGGGGYGAKGGGGNDADLPLLDNWEVLPDGRVKGAVYGRKGFTEGQEITTGAVVKRTSTEVTTASGSKYRLGKAKAGQRDGNDAAPSRARAGGGGGKEKPKWNGVMDDGDDDDLSSHRSGGSRSKDSRDNFPDVRRNGGGGGGGGRGGDEPPKKILGRAAEEKRAEGLDGTLEQYQADLYVGDRVRVRNNNHVRHGRQPGRGQYGNMPLGTVLYVGACAFAPGKKMVGLRMDEKPIGGGHDGKEQGERHFRCEAGYGCYVMQQDVTLVNTQGEAKGDEDLEEGEEEEPFDLEASLGRLVGIEGVKQHIVSLRNRLEVARRRAAFGVADRKPLHTVLVGSKGMDFKGMAEVYAGMLKSLSALRKDTVVEVSRKDVVGGNTEKTAELVAKALAKASGGVLLVQDAGGYGEKTDHYGQLALQLLVGHFEAMAEKESEAAAAEAKERAKAAAKQGGAAKPPPANSAANKANAALFQERAVLLLSTHRAGLAAVSTAAPGLASLGATQLEFMDYTSEEMAALLKLATERKGFQLAADLAEHPAKLVDLLRGPMAKADPNRGGLVLVERLVEEAINRQTDRVHLSETRSKASLLSLSEADFREEEIEASGENIEAVLSKLDAVIGLAGVKKHVRSLVAQLQLAQKKKAAGIAGGKVNATMHMVFSGNPGTGKTTVARLVAELLKGLGYLARGHLVETDRAGMVAPYVGQTAIKVQEVVESAMGGMLFVDEAYALVKDAKDSFGKEALDTLIKLVEDKRDELVVVLAGYPNEMDELMAHNPGVRSRFPTVILFEDYNVAELLEIASGFLSKQCLKMTEEATAMLAKKLTAMVEAPDVQNGNGRAVRNMVEQAMRAQALRLADDRATLRPAELSLLTAADFV